MKTLVIPGLFSFLTAGFPTCAQAASPAIGFAVASGTFEVNRSAVKGNTSLFEGSEVRTTQASSKLRINGGTRLEIATGSRVRVYSKRVVLEQGSGQVESPAPFDLEAASLRITPASSRSIARVQLEGARGVLVSAVNGPVAVRNAAGLLVASLNAGLSYRFTAQGGAVDAFEVTGCVLQKGGRFILVEQVTNQMFELRGKTEELTALLGNRGEIKGKASLEPKPIEGAVQAIQVDSTNLAAPGGCLAIAASVKADSLPGMKPGPVVGEAHKGVSTGVIVGIAVAGAGAAGAALALGKSSSSKSP